MKIAITYDFKNPVDISREGIGVYVKHLVSALLDYSKDLKIEIWTCSYNEKNVNMLFADSFSKYFDRLSLCNESITGSNNMRCFTRSLYYHIKRISYLLQRTFHKNKYKRDRYTQKLNHLYEKTAFDRLCYKASKSDADVVYAFFVPMKLGNFFRCPKFVQIHDLFTFAQYDLFAKDWNIQFLELYNAPILENLIDYAQNKAIFISSSRYIAKEHSLKFIPGITEEQTAVIPFPPLVKDFSDTECLSKEDFKKKYGIWEKYIAVPSQNRPNKNWKVIFKAMARLKAKGINLQFVTTGNISDIKSDMELVEELGIKRNILEIGTISEQDLYMLYKYEDIAVGSTIIEGMGISGQVIEALKVGNIPAVHSRCCGYKESLESVGLTEETADLNWFDTDDDETLANYMEDILKNPQAHIEKQRHIIDAYMSITWSDVAKKYMEIFCNQIDSQANSRPL